MYILITTIKNKYKTIKKQLMKKVIAIITMFILSVSVTIAQSTPDGMNYQAVARNLKGEILAKQPVALKVSLFKVVGDQKTEFYRETQQVTTSTVGVFSLILGKGQAEFGQFNDVPWSTENIWMEVAIKSKGENDFTSISNSKLLAVPYAFHAITAERVSNNGNTSGAVSAGSPSNSWLLFGNRNSNPENDQLGTTDSVDLKVITNNIDRLRIYGNGNIKIARSLQVGENLTVDKNVYLNKQGGRTMNYGPFTVDSSKATVLGGTLTVDQATDLNAALNVDGPVDMNGRLFVNTASPTKLTGTLRVDGVSDFNEALSVNNAKPTVLTGNLRADSTAIFKSYVKLTNSALDQDTAGGGANALPTGALQVAGGGYFGGSVVIKKDLKIGGELASGVLIATRDIESVSTTTGALIVKGGAGIGRNVNIGGEVKIDSNLIVKRDVTINSNTPSSDPSTGALVVNGGVGINGGQLNLTSDSTYVANFNNTSGRNGISIQINSDETADQKVNNDNNFIEFRNGAGDVVGRIEGETLAEMYANNSDYKAERKQYESDLTFGTIDVVVGAAEVLMAIDDLVGASTDFRGCFGLGACLASPGPADIANAIINLAIAIASEVATAISLDKIDTFKDDFVIIKDQEIGVTYESGAGDYAEYLTKADPSEDFNAGDIVGIKGGKISKNVNGAEKILVISKKPIVLGNVPSAENKNLSEKVAFLGQVPVRVFGKVNVGDYILPNGNNNGVGRAISPSKIKSTDLKNIVGIAWSEGSNNTGINTINVAVGLAINDNQVLVDEMKAEINNLQNQIAQTNAMLEKLVPGFKAPNGSGTMSTAVFNTPKSNNQPSTNELEEIKALGGVMNPDGSIYYRPSRDLVIQSVDFAMEKIENEKLFKGNEEFSKKLKDPSFKEMIVDKIFKELEKALAGLNEALNSYIKNKKG
jgi:hypothetical protein